jgi:hypothetical protein
MSMWTGRKRALPIDEKLADYQAIVDARGEVGDGIDSPLLFRLLFRLESDHLRDV